MGPFHLGAAAASTSLPVVGSRARRELLPSPTVVLGSPRTVGGYILVEQIGVGGMASVYLGWREDGKGPPVAIKRLHDFHGAEPAVVAMLHDEARLVSRIVHPNVVRMVDVVATPSDLLLVLEYVHGESLARILAALRRVGQRLPLSVASAIAIDLLRGLHAAHCATGDRGELLGIVHRDVSPQNLVVGVDGVSRVLDFGIAKAAGRIQTTREGQLKGKLAYMAPEQLGRGVVSARTDVYAAGIVLWELLVQRRLFDGDNEAIVFEQILLGDVEPPRNRVPDLPAEADAIALRALDRNPAARFATAAEMADALERCIRPAARSEIGAIVMAAAGEALLARARLIEGGAALDADDTIAEPDLPTHRTHPADVTSTKAVSAPLASETPTATRSDAFAASARSTTPRRQVAVAAACAVVVGAALFVYSRGESERSPPASSIEPALDEHAGALSAGAPSSASPSAVAVQPSESSSGTADAGPSVSATTALDAAPRAAPAASTATPRPRPPARRNDGFDRIFR